MMRDIRLIAAIGHQRQIGINGALPWHAPDDLRRFRQKTTGGILLMGQKTFASFPFRAPDPRNRVLAVLNRHSFSTINEHGDVLVRDGQDWLGRTDEVVTELLTYFPGRTIWVAGGARVYRAFMHHCTQFDVSLIDYVGPADTHLPTLPFEARQ